MNRYNLVIAILVVCIAALAILFTRVTSMKDDILLAKNEIHQLRDSLDLTHGVIDSLRSMMPGLGEYMSTIQLHTSKLWFAGTATNWKLANYELDELDETMEGAEGLHSVKDSVNVSAVLESVRNSQLKLLRSAIEKKNYSEFRDAYTQTLGACNGCHRPAGYEFIHIIVPTREPVSNQEWRSGTE